MDFLLDNDVDVEVARMLRRNGHFCEIPSSVGLTQALDDEYTVFAATRGWALISHDKEFSRRRRLHTIGQHVHLKCEQPDAPEILEDALPKVCPVLEHLPNAWIEVSRNKIKVDSSWH